MAKAKDTVAAFMFLGALALPVMAKNYIVNVSVDNHGVVTLDQDPVPPTGGLSHNDHIKWRSDEKCHLDVLIFDHDISQPENWSKPDDHGHSREADVDTPNKALVKDRLYLYTVTIWCDGGLKGSADPELVVAGGGFDADDQKKGTGGPPEHPAVRNINIKVNGNAASVDDPSALVYTDQKIHWHAAGGKVNRLIFADASVGDVPCIHNDCDRTAYDLIEERRYKYSVVVVDNQGHEHVTDPEIVVAGGQPPIKVRKRMAKE